MVVCVDSLFISASRLSSASMAQIQSSWGTIYTPEPEPALNPVLRIEVFPGNDTSMPFLQPENPHGVVGEA